MSEDTNTNANDDEGAQGGILDGYLTDNQLAVELKISSRSLPRWRQLGEAPPHIKVGRTNYTSRKTVRQWLADREGEAA